MKTRKKPKATAIDPTQVKSARAHHNPEDANQMRPAWSIRFFDVNGEWGRDKVGPEHLWDDLFEKLRNYETMTWGEILKDKTHNHDVSVEQLTKTAQDRLKAIKQDDVDAVFRLRLSGTQRVWGIRDRHILRLLWWDPDHEICPSVKKHT